MYVTRIDLVALAKQPLDNVDGLEVRCVRPTRALIASFPHLGPSLISKWAGPGHFFFLASHQGRPVGYRCLATVAPLSLKPFLRLRPHQLFTVDIFTAPDARRRGLTRAMKNASARYLVHRGYRETWSVQRVTNYDTVIASERTGSLRVGTLVRASFLGWTRFTLIPATVVSPTLVARQLDLLKHLAPAAKRVGVFFNPSVTRLSTDALEAITALAADRGVDIAYFKVREVTDQAAALEAIFRSMADTGVQGLIVHSDPMLRLNARSIVRLVRRYHLAAVFDAECFVVAGGFVACGAMLPGLHDFDAVIAHLDAQQHGAMNSDGISPNLEITVNHRALAASGLAMPLAVSASSPSPGVPERHHGQ
jgi:hypothetical protein